LRVEGIKSESKVKVKILTKLLSLTFSSFFKKKEIQTNDRKREQGLEKLKK